MNLVVPKLINKWLKSVFPDMQAAAAKKKKKTWAEIRASRKGKTG